MKPSTSVCVAAILVSSTLASADKHKQFTLADLKALVEQKSYNEALEHLSDVSPSERKADWQDLAGQAATGAVEGGKDAITKLAMMIEIEHQYPVVVKNAKYNALRTEVGPKGFQACWGEEYSDAQVCFDYAKKFVDDDPSNGKLALEIAKIGRKGMNSYNAVPLFKKAIAANKGSTVCKDEDLSLAVVAALALPPDYDDAKIGRELANTCWTDIRKAAMDQLAKEANSYVRKNTCEVAQTKKEPNTVRLCVEKKDD